MNRKYDIFEKFSDGSSLWRGCVSGLENTRIHLHEMNRHSRNEFYAIDIAFGKVIRLSSDADPMPLLTAKRSASRSTQRVA